MSFHQVFVSCLATIVVVTSTCSRYKALLDTERAGPVDTVDKKWIWKILRWRWVCVDRVEERQWWGGGVPDEKDFEGGDVLRWDEIAVFPNASKLAKLVSELPWGAAAIHKEKLTQTVNVEIKTMARQCMGWWQTKGYILLNIIY